MAAGTKAAYSQVPGAMATAGRYQVWPGQEPGAERLQHTHVAWQTAAPGDATTVLPRPQQPLSIPRA